MIDELKPCRWAALRALAEKACGTHKSSAAYGALLRAIDATEILDLTSIAAQPSDGALTNEPVAYIDPAHLKTMGKTATGSASCVIFNSSQGGCLKPLYCDTPAPASVVLPEHQDPDLRSPVYGYARGWNACLDRVKELNS